MKVLFEDNHLIAIQKNPGEITQGDKTGDIPLNEQVKTFIKEKYNKPGNVYVGTLHRLDRPVCGLVLFAKTSKAAERLSKAFATQKIEKTYFAICERKPTKISGTLVHFLKKDEKTNTSHAFSKEVNGAKRAELDYCLIAEIDGQCLIKVTPKTGRSHQIRVQLASMGCPILGDVKYGSKHKTSNRSLYLCCYSMEFIHPVKKEKIKLLAEWPMFDHWAKFIDHVESHYTK